MQKHDPDSYLLLLRTPANIKKWLNTEQDYISDYLPAVLQAQGTGPKAMRDQIKRMGNVLELIPDGTLRSIYYDEVGKYWPAFKKNYKLAKREVVSLPQLNKLKVDDKSLYFDFGFWTEGGCYYSMKGESKQRIATFTIEVLFFVTSESMPKYVCLFTNMWGISHVKAISTDDFSTVGSFKKCVEWLGPGFIFEGNDVHLNKVKLKVFYGTRRAAEPKFMGYNQHGDFYTWANGLYYRGEFFKTNKHGIVDLRHPIEDMEAFKALRPETHIMMGTEVHIIDTVDKFLESQSEESVRQYIDSGNAWKLSFYFLPFSSSLKVSDHDDDNFEFERKFKYMPPMKNYTYEVWARLMVDVYGDNGLVAVAYYHMTVHRDIIYKGNNSYMPILFFAGMKGSGKSTCARSLSRMFGEGSPDGVNLQSGSTATGIGRYMASMQNAIMWLNEYKNTLPEYTIGMLKGIADGSGKLTGRNTSGNETKTYVPRCSAVIGGQDLPTRDPALLSRTVPCEFDVTHRNRAKMDELLILEGHGVGASITCEVLQYRSIVKEKYVEIEPVITRIIRARAKETIGDVDDRLLLNVSTLLTTCLIIALPTIEADEDAEIDDIVNAMIDADENTYTVQLGFKLSKLCDVLMSKLKVQVDIQHTSDDVEQYFQVLMGMVERRIITEGTHYKITKTELGKALLYLRIGTIHSLYRQAAGSAGYAVMDLGTLKSYLTKHKSAIEYKEKGVKFQHENNGTSAMVMDYDLLNSYGIQFRMAQDLTRMLSDDNELMK